MPKLEKIISTEADDAGVCNNLMEKSTKLELTPNLLTAFHHMTGCLLEATSVKNVSGNGADLACKEINSDIRSWLWLPINFVTTSSCDKILSITAVNYQLIVYCRDT